MTNDRSRGAGETPERPRRTVDEIRAELREFQRDERDRKIRMGRAKPRTLREFEIFAKDLLGETAPDDGEAGS